MSGITTDVCITPRVIAAGVFGSTFRLTLALLPTAPDAARKDAPRFDVSSWPQVVDGAGPIGLFVSPVAAAGDARPAPVYAGAGKAIGVRRRSLLTAKDSEAALRLWRVIVTGQTTPDAQRPEFLHLCDALARSQRDPKGGGTASRVDGAAAGAPAVLPTGRADAALAYTMERAERILAALRNDATASPVARPGATDEQGPPPWTKEYWTPDVTGAVAKRIELAHRKALEARSDEVRAELQPDVERATAQIAARGGYLGEGSLRGAIALLTGSAAGRCSRNPSESSAASSDAATQHVRALHEASTLPDDPSASPSPSLGALDGVDVAERRLFALQAHPTLGRLFGLVVDVEGDLADLDASLAAAFAGGFADLAFGPKAGGPMGRTAGFAFLACSIGMGGSGPQVWTLAKASRAPGCQPSWFWPCTREEMEFAVAGTPRDQVLASCAVNQVDGLLDLGMAVVIPDGPLAAAGPDGIAPGSYGCGPGTHRRFDMVSVDTVLSAEGDVRRERHAKEGADLAARTGAAVPGAARLPPPRPMLTSAGLALVDRWRQQRVASEIASGAFGRSRGDAPVVLDAEDLMVGHKVDVGVRLKSGWAWRTLMNRTVSFALPEPLASASALHPGAVDGLIAKLVPDRDERVLLESGTVSVASRLRGHGGGGTIHVEENVADWQGEPLGASCRTQRLEVDGDVDLGLSRTYGLPSRLDGMAAAPDVALPGRFGWRYRMGIRATYVGGVAAPFAHAASRYDEGFGGRFSAPRRLAAAECGGAAPAEGRRFLRHEPVGTPIVLQTAEEAAAPTAFAPQSSDVVVLRTCHTDRTRSDPKATRRIVLAPRVLQAFAARHGVFDRLARLGRTQRPPGALAAVDFDAPWGEFPLFRLPPDALSAGGGRVEANVHEGLAAWHEALDRFEVAVAASVAGIAGKKLSKPPMGARQARCWTWREAKADLERRRLGREFDAHAWLAAAGLGEAPAPDRLDRAARAIQVQLDVLEQVVAVPEGQPAFRARRPSEAAEAARVTPFYPDPAADMLVIAARHPGTDEYFPGIPITLQLAGPCFPDTTPVVVDFVAVDRPREGAPTQADLVRRRAPGSGRLDHVLGRSPPGSIAVEVPLMLGEHVALDMWCVPSVARLAAIFDAVESIAVCATAASPAGAGATDACLAGLAAKAGGAPARPHGEGDAWCGAAGVPATTVGVKAAAGIVFAHMCRLPLPDVAAVRTVDCLNAVDQPVHPPSFSVPDGKTGLRIALYEGTEGRDALVAERAESWEPTLATAAPGRLGVLVGGHVSIDRATTGMLELQVSCVAPRAGVIDAPARSRTKEERYRGIWRRRPGAPDEYLKASDVFGFEVAADGRAKLREASDVVLRFEAIGELGGSGEGPGVLDLLAEQVIEEPTLQERSAAGAPGGVPAPGRSTGEKPPLFPGGLARRLTLTLVATARHLPHFRRIAPGRDGAVEAQFPPSRAGAPSSEPPAAVTATGASIVRWLPATRRPDKVQRRSIVPAFLWYRGTEQADPRSDAAAPKASWTRRTSVLRVRMERGWFSSGVGERLGIVVWPPALFSLDADDLAAGRVPRVRPPADAASDPMELGEFDDAFLGEGGPFVSRWGADPIRGGAGPEGPLMPARAFADHDPDTALTAAAATEGDRLGEAPVYVVDARMPLPPLLGGEPRATPRHMPVGLLTYEPRFDVDQEDWYVDVALDPLGMVEPFVRLGLVRYQPHAPVDLQVSEPIAEWAQILPERTLRASVGSTVGGRFWPIHVEVSGDAARRTRDPVSPAVRARPLPSMRPVATGLPRVRIRLLKEGVAPGGSTVREWADVVPSPFAAAGAAMHAEATAAAAELGTAVTRRSGGAEVEVDAGSGDAGRPAGSAAWAHTFFVTEDPGKCRSGERMVVEVEEFDEFAPATYPHEPVVGADDLSKTAVASGPRFVAKLELA